MDILKISSTNETYMRFRLRKNLGVIYEKTPVAEFFSYSPGGFIRTRFAPQSLINIGVFLMVRGFFGFFGFFVLSVGGWLQS
jgi:hypothetical protein